MTNTHLSFNERRSKAVPSRLVAEIEDQRHRRMIDQRGKGLGLFERVAEIGAIGGRVGFDGDAGFGGGGGIAKTAEHLGTLVERLLHRHSIRNAALLRGAEHEVGNAEPLGQCDGTAHSGLEGGLRLRPLEQSSAGDAEQQ